MTNLPTTLLLACWTLSAAAPAAAAVRPQAPTPPAFAATDRALTHLDGAQAAAAAGEVERVLEHLRQGLAGEGTVRRSHARARLELWAVQWLEHELRRCVDAGDTDAAAELLARVDALLRSEFAQQSLELLERRLDDTVARDGRRTRADRDEDLLQRRLGTYARLLDRADTELDGARASSRRTVEAARRAEVALRRYRSVEQDVNRELAGLDPHRPGVARLIALQLRASDGVTRSMLQLADARLTQGDFRTALHWVDRVQLREPANAAASELRRTIQLAAAAASGWLGFGGANAPAQ
jgi:hypothetical protein